MKQEQFDIHVLKSGDKINTATITIAPHSRGKGVREVDIKTHGQVIASIKASSYEEALSKTVNQIASFHAIHDSLKKLVGFSYSTMDDDYYDELSPILDKGREALDKADSQLESINKWQEPPIPSGMKRAYTVCGTCGEPCYYDYVPFSLSSPIFTLPCHHGMTEPRSGLKDVTREKFIALMNKQMQEGKKKNAKVK